MARGNKQALEFNPVQTGSLTRRVTRMVQIAMGKRIPLTESALRKEMGNENFGLAQKWGILVEGLPPEFKEQQQKAKGKGSEDSKGAKPGKSGKPDFSKFKKSKKSKKSGPALDTNSKERTMDKRRRDELDEDRRRRFEALFEEGEFDDFDDADDDLPSDDMDDDFGGEDLGDEDMDDLGDDDLGDEDMDMGDEKGDLKGALRDLCDEFGCSMAELCEAADELAAEEGGLEDDLGDEDVGMGDEDLDDESMDMGDDIDLGDEDMDMEDDEYDLPESRQRKRTHRR